MFGPLMKKYINLKYIKVKTAKITLPKKAKILEME